MPLQEKKRGLMRSHDDDCPMQPHDMKTTMQTSQFADYHAQRMKEIKAELAALASQA